MRFLFVDRILQLTPSWVKGIKHVTQEDAYLSREHNKLFFLPSLIGETLGQLTAWAVMVANNFTQRPVAGVVSRACVHRPAYVNETLLLESFIDHLDDTTVHYHSVAHVNDELVFSIEGALGPLLPMALFINEEEVRRQFAEINRPGDWPVRSVATLEAEPMAALPEQLSFPSMQFDRILHSEPGVSLVAEKRVSRSAPYFPDHFPNKPVLPMTVLLECKLNLAREFLARASLGIQYQVKELCKIKMNEFIYPGDVVVCFLKVKQRDDQQLILSYRSEVEGRRVCVLEIVLVAAECERG